MPTIKSGKRKTRTKIWRWIGRIGRGSREAKVVDLVAYRAQRERERSEEEKKSHG